MKATGEVMAIDRTFESSFLKAVISLEGKDTGLRRKNLINLSRNEIETLLNIVDDQRIFAVAEALRKGITVEKINVLPKIDPWFLEKINNIIKVEKRLQNELFLLIF